MGRTLLRPLGQAAFLMILAIWLACGCAPAFAANSVDTGQLPDGSFIYEVKIGDLMADSTYYDNQTVQVSGEVVGDRIREESGTDYCWITLAAPQSETSGSVEVLVTNELADQITTYGHYGTTGSTVRVMGTFHANCSAHDGLEDIHATDLTVESAGSSTPDVLNTSELAASLLFAALGLVALFAYQRYRARSR
jgi:hypothetical protein